MNAGIYNPVACYDPKKAVEKARLDERYKSLVFLWFEWKKLDHEYSAASLRVHKRIETVLSTIHHEHLNLGNAHGFLEAYRMLGYSDGTVKRDLNDIVACVNYWCKLGKVAHNPYPAIKSQLTPKKHNNKGRFTANERAIIIQSLGVNAYRDLVQFLFMTGLRPEEAIPLTWGDINFKKGLMQINKTYSKGDLRHNTKQGKKGKIVHRAYRLDKSQTDFLLRPSWEESALNEIDNALVFPSPKGTYINWGNFNKRIWKPLLTDLVALNKIRKYLKPYCMRHTAITNMIKRGDRINVIAAQVGTSIEMITKTYLISNDWWIDDDTGLDLSSYSDYISEYSK
ncbi:site-specific integrase [[Leptolyngbya] sp. PCC 7376]|uniref:tyrosine-type recombinase/integrase n=1 Tax=[Leptolyngbya] sp. PCC 7376 TaxID=111781 RepID=UPI001C1DF306|nr:site-specific integrase [[Leptolyngbya] sp. PCC 7376]